METKCSLPCSQQPATGPSPQPNKPSPNTSYFLKNLIIMSSRIYTFKEVVISGFSYQYFSYHLQCGTRSRDLSDQVIGPLWSAMLVPPRATSPFMTAAAWSFEITVKLGSTQSQSGSSDNNKGSLARRQSSSNGKGSLPCRNSWPPSERVRYPKSFLRLRVQSGGTRITQQWMAVRRQGCCTKCLTNVKRR
jgi:hypothetical protein